MSTSSSDWTQSLVSCPKHDTRGPTAITTTEFSGSGNQVTSSKGSPSKPSRRRSRASRRTPTTLLNATTANFRALVQQFTGCPRNLVPLGARKGPVTLNFGGQHDDQYYTQSNYSYNPSSPVIAPATCSVHHHQNGRQEYDSPPPVTAALQQLHGHRQYHTYSDEQQQRCMYSSSSLLNHVDHDSDHVFLSGDMESNVVEDELLMENLSSLHEILGRDSNLFMSEDLMR